MIVEQTIKAEISAWIQGNFGALNFLTALIELPDENGQRILNKLNECESIRGTNLWVLYSDLCEKDMNKVELLCQNCPSDILEDACSRQDYSGRKLVAEYLVKELEPKSCQ